MVDEVHQVVGVRLSVVIANEHQGVIDVVHRCIKEIKAIACLAVRHEHAVPATAPVSDGNAAQEHALDTFAIRARVEGVAVRIQIIAREVHPLSVDGGVFRRKGAAEALRMDLGNCARNVKGHISTVVLPYIVCVRWLSNPTESGIPEIGWLREGARTCEFTGSRTGLPVGKSSM